MPLSSQVCTDKKCWKAGGGPKEGDPTRASIHGQQN